MHRVGRTGRFGKRGIAVSLIDSERTRNFVDDLANQLGQLQLLVVVSKLQLLIDACRCSVQNRAARYRRLRQVGEDRP